MSRLAAVAAQPIRAWSPATRWIVGLVLFTVVVVNAVMHLAYDGESTWTFALGIASGKIGHWDSWRWMGLALDYFHAHPDEPLYRSVFFEQHLKFQYPLTSLLPLVGLDALGIGNRDLVQRADALNAINALAFLAYLGLAYAVVRVVVRRYGIVADGASFVERHIVILALWGAAALYFPVLRALQLGQVQMWIDVLFLVALLLWLHGRRGASGITICLAVLFKPQLGLFAVWGAWRREWRFVAAVLAVGALGLLASVILFGFWNNLGYLEVLRFISAHGEAAWNNQSFNGLLNRALFNGSNLILTQYGFPPYHRGIHVASTVWSLAVLGLAVFAVARNRGAGSPIDFCIAAVSFTVASPVAWEHHYGILPPVLLVALGTYLDALRRGALARPVLVGTMLALGYVLTANYLSVTKELADGALNVLQSYRFFGALVLLGSLYVLRGAASETAAARERDRRPRPLPA